MHLIHIGLPKAGSTFLQRQVFAEVKQVKVISSHDSIFIPDYFRWILQICRSYDSLRTVDLVEAFERDNEILKQAQKKFSKALSKRHHLISSEGLVGVVHNPNLFAGKIAEFLHSVAPSSKILIVVRKHIDWMESIWRQVVYFERRGGVNLSLMQMFGEAESLVKFSDIKWSKLAETYGNLFGYENLLILPFELLQRDDSNFVQQVSSFFEIKVHRKKFTIEDPNSQRHILSQPQGVILMSRYPTYSKDWILRANSHATADSMVLQKYCHWNLDELGYYNQGEDFKV
jgi:hypothetical protein